MASQIYILENMETLTKLKNAISEKLWAIEAVKFNGEYSISLEGWDVLTFLHIGMDDPKSHLIENAPYEIVRLFNHTSTMSNDVVQHIVGFLPSIICEAYDVDFDNLGDNLIFDYIEGTNHDFKAIANGNNIELIEDFVMSKGTLDRLVKIIETDKFVTGDIDEL